MILRPNDILKPADTGKLFRSKYNHNLLMVIYFSSERLQNISLLAYNDFIMCLIILISQVG